MTAGHDPMPPDDWRDLLSALLDGELAPDEEARVRALVAESPDAQEELAALTQVRSWVRDLPAVDPPFGFYERMLRPAARHPRHRGAKVLGALAAAAAAVVLVVGIIPAADSIAPPVAAYAARHQEMDPATAPVAAAAPLAETAGDFEPVPADDLDAMGTPASLSGDFERMSGYQNDDGAVHLVYSDGAMVVSVYEQPGLVAWDSLPDGTMVQVDGTPAWTMATDHEEVMVLERGPMVYTVVARATTDTHDEMMAVAVALPVSDPSMLDRFRHGCRSVAAQFSMGAEHP